MTPASHGISNALEHNSDPLIGKDMVDEHEIEEQRQEAEFIKEQFVIDEEDVDKLYASWSQHGYGKVKWESINLEYVYLPDKFDKAQQEMLQSMKCLICKGLA